MRARVPATLIAAAALIAGCGQTQRLPGPSPQKPPSAVASLGLHAHPQAIEPLAGAAPQSAPTDPNQPASVTGPTSGPLPQPASEAVIQREVAQSGVAANSETAQLADGIAVPPANAPPQILAVIAVANRIAKLPYRFGGGHATFLDTAYDCSGSLSYAFAAAHIFNNTMTSGELANWGLPGPGKWITIYANNGHTFAYIAGLRFDTVARAETGSRWSNRPANEPDLSTFAIRHPPGL